MRQIQRVPGPGGPKPPAREPTRLGVGTEIPEEAPTARLPVVAAAPEIPEEAPMAPSPIVAAAPPREKTALGIGWPPSPLAPSSKRQAWREPSVQEPPADDWETTAAPEPAASFERRAAIDLVGKKARPLEHLEVVEEWPQASAPAHVAERRVATVKVPRRRGRRRWLGLLVLLASLALLGGGAYRYRNRIPQQQLRSFVTSTVARGHRLLSRLGIH
jgi:hypothetical protein